MVFFLAHKALVPLRVVEAFVSLDCKPAGYFIMSSLKNEIIDFAVINRNDASTLQSFLQVIFSLSFSSLAHNLHVLHWSVTHAVPAIDFECLPVEALLLWPIAPLHCRAAISSTRLHHKAYIIRGRRWMGLLLQAGMKRLRVGTATYALLWEWGAVKWTHCHRVDRVIEKWWGLIACQLVGDGCNCARIFICLRRINISIIIFNIEYRAS